MPPSHRRPTLRDVARLAGVSTMTACRAAKNPGLVAASTAQRVRAAAAKLGYQPDPVLSALAAYRSGTRTGGGSVLAFLDPDGSPYNAAVCRGVAEEARLLGYGTTRLPLAGRPARALGRALYHRGIQGVLIGPSDEPQDLSDWDWSRFSVVALGALEHRPQVNAVTMDYFHGAFCACEHLREEGCARIGMLVEKRLQARTDARWLGGYLAWAERRSARPFCLEDRISSPAHVSRWLAKCRLDGLVTIHPHCEAACVRRGVRVAYLNRAGAGLSQPFYDLDAAALGREATRMIHHALLRREFGLPGNPKHVALRGTLAVPAPA